MYDEYFKLSLTDNDTIFNDNINRLKKNSFYNQVKNLKPTKYYLYDYYDF